MPMMQFSVAHWSILDEEHLKAVKKAVEIRQDHIDLILDLAFHASKTGEPIVRSMEYVFPYQGYAEIKDQFLLGNRLLITPVLEKGKKRRVIQSPKGEWRGSNHQIFHGPKKVEMRVRLADLLYFNRLD